MQSASSREEVWPEGRTSRAALHRSEFCESLTREAQLAFGELSIKNHPKTLKVRQTSAHLPSALLPETDDPRQLMRPKHPRLHAHS